MLCCEELYANPIIANPYQIFVRWSLLALNTVWKKILTLSGPMTGQCIGAKKYEKSEIYVFNNYQNEKKNEIYPWPCDQ